MSETQVNARVPDEMLARIDGFGALLGIERMSRGHAVRELIRRGIEATDAGMAFAKPTEQARKATGKNARGKGRAS